MKTKLKFLTFMSLKKKMFNKWFVIANIVLAILIIAVANIDTIITKFGGDFNEATEIIVIDNTERSYDLFKNNFIITNEYLENIKPAEVSLYDKNEEEALKDVEKEKTILIVFNNDLTNTLSAKITSYKSIDDLLYSSITTAINSTKSFIAIENSNISLEEITNIYSPVKVEKIYLEKDAEKNNDLLMGAIFPLLILPFFMLSIYLVQMIGAEINDEKTTRGMEIIIGNVSPKVHFFSKVLSGNLFVFLQGSLLFIYGGIALITRNLLGAGSIMDSLGSEATGIWQMLKDSGFIDKLIIIIPITLLLMILSFLAYSLLAGILASMTTNIEDYQQLQMPIMIVSILGYYLSIMSTMFDGSIFIKGMSYIPLISALLSPALLILGEIGLIDVSISILILIGFNYLLIRYGLRIYKVGILNYSSSKLWRKMLKAVKNKNTI